MKTISGIFDNKTDASQALAALFSVGFNKDHVSLLVSENSHTLFNSTDDEASRVALGGATGAALGGALGALFAGLAAVGTIAVPGAGLLVAGPVVAALSGIGVGATVGGFTGALVSAGYAADEANHFEQEVKNGKAVIIVHTHDESKAAAARQALMKYNAATETA